MRILPRRWKFILYCWWHGVCLKHGRIDLKHAMWTKDGTPLCPICEEQRRLEMRNKFLEYQVRFRQFFRRMIG